MSTEAFAQALAERDQAILSRLDKLDERTTKTADTLADLQQKGAANTIDYSHAPPRPSLMKVIKHLANPRDCKLDGRELEWHSELAAKSGRNFPGAVWVPLSTKTLDYSTVNFNSPLESAGGSNLVRQELYRELVDVLRQKSTVLQQGVTLIGAEGDLDIPKKSESATAYWLDLDGVDSITPSTSTYTQIQLRPKFVTALTKISYRMMVQTGGAVERIVQDDLAATLAEAVDLAALQGSGSNSQPRGVLNQSGIGSLTWGGSASPQAWPNTRFWFNSAVEMEETLITAKAYGGNLSFIVDPITYRSARFDQDTEGADQFCVDRDGRRLLGYGIFPTVNMPSRTALLGDWSQFVAATWGGVALAADGGGDNFAKGDLSVRAILPIDFNVRHAAAFVKSVGSA